MIKSHYILLLLVCFSFTNSDKISSKNLRKLVGTNLSFSRGENLRYESNQLKFDLVLSEAPSLSNGNYQLTIKIKDQKVSSTCTYASTEPKKLSCVYNSNVPHYASIVFPDKNSVLNTDTISIQRSSPLTLYTTNTISLTYKNAVMQISQEGYDYIYNIQVYLDDPQNQISLTDQSYLDLGLDLVSGYSVAGCTYSSSSKMLDCNVIGNKNNKVKFITDKKNGAIKWTNNEFSDESVILKLEAQTNIYGYNLDFINNQWNFNIYMTNSNMGFTGYYYKMNVILKKTDNSQQTANALCYRTSANAHKCTLSEGTQAKDDLVYINHIQTESTLSFKNNFLTEDKIMSRIITLKFIDAYGLKYQNYKWNFNIKAEAEGEAASIIRDGLNVTVALSSASTNYTASCIYMSANEIFSCKWDKGSGQDATDLISLVPQKSVGSVTWSNKKDSTEYIKIPLDIELTHVSSFDLFYEENKWVFRINAKPSVQIPGQSFIKIDILYDTNKYTLAECVGISTAGGSVSANGQTTYVCECDTLGDTVSFQISNTQNKGSVTWKSLSEPITIQKRLGFKFIKAYNLEIIYTTSEKKWIFEIEYQNPNNLNLATSTEYKIDIVSSSSTTTDYKKPGSAKCSLKEGSPGILSCGCDIFITDEVKDVVLYISKSKTFTEEYIIWTEGFVGEYYQMNLKTQLKFVKGILSNTNKWYLNIDVNDPKEGTLPINSKLTVAVTEGSTDKSIECFVISRLLLKCDTGLSSAVSDLPQYSVKKEGSSTSSVTWTNEDSDTAFDYLYLSTTLEYKSDDGWSFSTNIWTFNLETSTFPDKTKIIIDVLYAGSPSTATCTKDSTKSPGAILCEVDKEGQSKNDLVKISYIKSEQSTITWTTNSLSGHKDITLLAKLNVNNANHLFYRESINKWEFKMNLESTDIPLNSMVKVAVEYQSTPGTATCIHESQNILTCTVDAANQNSDGTLALSSPPDDCVLCATYIGTPPSTIQIPKKLVFEKAYDLTLSEGNKWQFKIQLSEANIEDNTNVNADVRLNGIDSLSLCSYTSSTKTLVCKIDKTSSADRIILINKGSDQSVAFYKLDEYELYISYKIKYINYYGGFHENRWKFNLKYDRTDETISVNNNYALLDILVGTQKSTALCLITEIFLMCESKHSGQSKDDQIKLAKSLDLGTVTLSNLPETIETLTPISIRIEKPHISNFNANDKIVFTITGDLKNSPENIIAENTITGVEIVVGNNNPIDALCMTNSINNSPVNLDCEASGSVNKDEEDVYIKIDSNGKSKYITFDSITENISIYKIPSNPEESQPAQESKPSEGGKTPEESKAPEEIKKEDNKESGFMMKINNLILFGVFLLF